MGVKRTRKRYDASFKVRVALAAMRDRSSLAELASKFRVHRNLVAVWKRRLIENASAAFNGPAARNAMRDECQREIELSHQTTRDEESWMMDVLQGRFSAEEIANEVGATLLCSDAEHLYWCVMNDRPLCRSTTCPRHQTVDPLPIRSLAQPPGLRCPN